MKRAIRSCEHTRHRTRLVGSQRSMSVISRSIIIGNWVGLRRMSSTLFRAQRT